MHSPVLPIHASIDCFPSLSTVRASVRSPGSMSIDFIRAAIISFCRSTVRLRDSIC
jgi:hypothetical protein